ncbi:MAG: DMT family transporter [Crocinitomicaceae bacterium]
MGGKLKYYIILHLIVLVWGVTGILGDEISITADKITFFRTGISFLSLLLVGLFIKNGKKLSSRQILSILGTGVIVGLHWYCFFYSIKVSNVSIGVVCMSSSTLFTSILEPIIFKRKFAVSELILSFAIIAGILVIFGFETRYSEGILFGLISAFFAALFTVINGRMIKNISSFNITKYEMLGGMLVLFVILLITGKVDHQLFEVPAMDWVYLVVLGIICTTVAFMVSVWVMKHVTPFTVSMSVNMEPIYTIIIALFIAAARGSNKEQMSGWFYVGGAIILLSIFTNAYLKKRKKVLKEDENLLDSVTNP